MHEMLWLEGEWLEAVRLSLAFDSHELAAYYIQTGLTLR